MQDFGYSRTAHAGRTREEIGGLLTPDAQPAYCARKIPVRTLKDILTASGTLTYTPTAAGGALTVTLDAKTVSIDLEAAHRERGARFDRFGIVTTWIDGNAQQVYFDDLTYTCK